MNLKKLFKILSKVLPNFIIFGLMNNIMCARYGIKIGKKSKVYFGSFFEGHNAVFDNTEVKGSHVGLCSFMASDSKIRFAKIGRFCSIGDSVKIGVGQHPSKNFVSTHPAFYSLIKNIDITFAKKQKFEDQLFVDLEKKYVVEIGNDVWIGSNVLVVDGIKIGDGAIIGAGAIVTKDVSAYTIVGGVPAKLIRYRFTDEQIKFLMDFKWWNNDFDWIKKNYEYFSDMDIFINKFKK